jgi:hypothetical protein
VSANEEPVGAVVARSTEKNTSGGSVRGWQVGADAGSQAVVLCGRHEVRHAAMHGHEPASGNERGGMSARAKPSAPLWRGEHDNQTNASPNTQKTMDTTGS